MGASLSFPDLDLSFVPAVVAQDPHWIKCIELALRSKSEDQRYGSLIILNNHIIGEGWNRLLKKSEPFPFPTSFFLHAEIAAIGEAIGRNSEKGIAGATVYVAGFFVKSRRPLILKHITNTCVNCTKKYPRFKLNAAFISRFGWVQFSGEKAYQNALDNQKLRKEQKLSAGQLRMNISL
ncbi:hypothetical protein KW791_03845 [Candidatus Parcubacteria bacterium]|nr:hypothetical protein [Candidatus Parcubacteria bacterium]